MYPENPYVTRDAIFAATIGVSRYERESLQRTWHALPGAQTFEPVVTEKTVLVGSTDGLYSLELQSGRIQWRVGSAVPIYSPVVYDDTAYVGAADGVARAVKLDSGRIVWSRRFDGWIYPPAVVDGLLVFGGSNGRLYGVHRTTGAVAWTKPLNQELVYRPVPIPDRAVVITTFSGDVIAVSATDGATVWEVRDPTPGFSPVVDGDRVYMGTFGGALRVRHAVDGRLIWVRRFEEKLPFVPRLQNRTVLIGSEQGHVAAFSTLTGRLLWRREHPVALGANPVMIDGRIVALTAKGELVAIGP